VTGSSSTRCAPAITDCDVLEVSTPEVDDVVRIQDDYGR
jgi:hypothetical protein